MQSSKLVSVLMGIYNCEDTLAESINSLLNQTYKDFELILCDDGSTDNTYKIAQEYAANYSNIILLKNNKNMGLNYTLNHCFEYAHGEYIARQDGDDISLPERFEKEIKLLESNTDIAIVSCSMIHFNNNGDFKITKNIMYPQKKDFVHSSAPFFHPCCMIRKSVMDDVGAYSVSKWLIRVEDYHLFCKIYARGYTGYNIQEPLYKFRDDLNAYKRRNFRSRINGMYAYFIGFKMLKLPFYYYIYCLRPIIVGVLPYFVYRHFHNK